MKTLLVDIDRAMLQHCAARIGSRQPLVLATSKTQVMELLRHSASYEVVVACERVADGSGLALLDDIHTRWPHLIRVFCAERQRLAMLRTRLGALRLRHTLNYPVKPVKLELLLVHLQHLRTATLRTRIVPG